MSEPSKELLYALCAPLLDTQKERSVFTANCCGKTAVSVEPLTKCSTCGGVLPFVQEITRDELLELSGRTPPRPKQKR